MSRESRDTVSIWAVPEFDGLVEGTGRHLITRGIKLAAVHGPLMSLECGELLSCGHVPETGRLILRCRGEKLTVTGEGTAVDHAGMSFEDPDACKGTVLAMGRIGSEF